METIGDFIGALFKVWLEMLGAFLAVLPKAIMFILWLVAAVFILPCVFIAGEIYPKWVEWGENF